MLGDSDLGLRMYSLDRFVDMEELDQIFEIPEEFDAEEFFNKYFGVCLEDNPVVDVVIRVEDSQAKYFRSLPKHSSQKEADPIDGWTVFTYRLVPTFDFKQEILSYGADVEVLAPESLRKEMADIAVAMNKLYRKK